ncbi:MAG TPA: sigma factor [Pseudonocardia sp.]|uniref:sigma factor n=1 Tax=Pseudonocardia sp. TaxID=60912 RepID=UPI002F3F8DE0
MAVTIGTDFDGATAPLRRELVVHCYRCWAPCTRRRIWCRRRSRAWQARDRYDQRRASLRTWLYRIATNACLSALDGRARRPLPSGLGRASDDPHTPLVPDFEVPWL